jgi:hypothetical protein
MTSYSLSSMPVDTWIAGQKTVKDWLDLREALIEDSDNIRNWEKASEFFRLRVGTRFLKPIEAILDIKKNLGEGHSACAIQCMLIEFLEALFQGKLYRTAISEKDQQKTAEELGVKVDCIAGHTQPTKYTSSRGLFISFLTTRHPFLKHFNKSRAEVFYSDIRCGLLHEAATKRTSKVRAEDGANPGCLVKDVKGGIVVYRDPFQRALLQCIERYCEDLLSNRQLQINFVRKLDEIAGIGRCFYFAYGSNLERDNLRARVQHIHAAVTGRLDGFGFRYNKKSIDGTSKANIVVSQGESVWGACYEIDDSEFKRLHDEHEKGYVVKKVWTATEKGAIIAKTFVSSSVTTASPQPTYVLTVITGATQHGLPDDYIEKCLRKTK